MIDFEAAFGVKLTPIERKLLERLQGSEFVSEETLLESVWGYHRDAKSRTVKTHVDRLRKKLPKGWIRNIRDVGYQLVVDPDRAVELAIDFHGAKAVGEAWFRAGGNALSVLLQDLRNNHVIVSFASEQDVVELASTALPRLLSQEQTNEMVLISAFASANLKPTHIQEFSGRAVESLHVGLYLEALGKPMRDPTLEYVRRTSLGNALSLVKRTEEASRLLVDDDSVPEFYHDRLIRMASHRLTQRRARTAIALLERVLADEPDPDNAYTANGYLAMAYTDARDSRARELIASLSVSPQGRRDHGAMIVESAYFELVVGNRKLASEILDSISIQEIAPWQRLGYLIVRAWLGLEHDIRAVRSCCAMLARLVPTESTGAYIQFFTAATNWLEHGVTHEFSELVGSGNPLVAAFSRWVLGVSPERLPVCYRDVLIRHDPKKVTVDIFYELLAVATNVD